MLMKAGRRKDYNSSEGCPTYTADDEKQDFPSDCGTAAGDEGP